MTTATKYEVVIGIEVHAQVLTRSKMFCACDKDYYDSPPNTHVCPVCLGMPGVLPVINRRAVEFTIMTGLALNCTIPERAKFDRKNYPYPDIMKGYQISQYDMPLCKDGWLEIDLDGGTQRIGITRVHLEEDVARLTHRTSLAGEDYSLVDVNRSGVPLMEIVSEPDVRSGREARLYVTRLQQILRYVGASRANMEEGNMRCEPNVSLRPFGQEAFGAKVELKNLNSFRAVEHAIDYEIERQTEILDRGGTVDQETRGWRDDEHRTFSQRGKEFAEDYRYFPEPDLPPLAISRAYVEELRARLPELPEAKRQRFLNEYGLSHHETDLLIATKEKAEFFEKAIEAWKTVNIGPSRLVPDGEAVIEGHAAAKNVANWMLGDLSRLLNESGLDLDDPAMKLTPDAFARLLGLVQSGKITGTAAKDILTVLFRKGGDPEKVVEEQGLTQISAADELSDVIEQVIDGNPKPVADYHGGKEEALKFLVGQVMRQTRGRAKPDLVHELLRERLTKS